MPVAGIRTVFLRLPRRARNFAAACLLLLLAQGTILWFDHGIERALRVYNAPKRRQKIDDTLVASGGRHLIFVLPEKPYALHLSWVFNGPNFTKEPVLWAWDWGPVENLRLMACYPDRQSLLMTLSDQKTSFAPLLASPPPAL